MSVYEQAQLCRTAWLALVLCLENGTLACRETASHRRLWLRVPGLLSFNGAVALATLVPGCRPIPNYAPHLHQRCTPFLFSVVSIMPMQPGMQDGKENKDGY